MADSDNKVTMSLSDLFKEVYANKMANMIPNGVGALEPDFDAMPLKELEKWTKKGNTRAQEVYARRTSKLGKYLENV